MTDNKEHHLFPVDELGLDDATVEILKSGDLNVRLICEMIKNPTFANFLLAEDSLSIVSSMTLLKFLNQFFLELT